jgi:murein DD-endopeptidase MepM/ murein hydrolase activator NlpD
MIFSIRFLQVPSLRKLGAFALLIAVSPFAEPSYATPVTGIDCGGKVRLQVSPTPIPQGSLHPVTISSASLISELKATWDTRELPFWIAQPWHKGLKEQRKALFGVDLEKAPGQYELAASGQLQGGQTFSCKAMIKVVLGHFATESLKVEKQFVQPDDAQVKRANAERDLLRGIFDGVTPDRLWTGPFREPLDGVVSGGNFGKRRILNGIPGSPHGGVDFPSPTGTPIHATQAGRVALAQELFFSGNTVVIDHGLGIYTFYGHLSVIDVKPGDEVEAGQVLGKVGATGRVTGPHLHWGLTVNRARVNALDILKILGPPPK